MRRFLLLGLGALLLAGIAVASSGGATQADARWAMTYLGTLGDASGATAVNDRGQVIGWSDHTSGFRHAFYWERGKMTDLGTLGGRSTVARGMNERGQVVGKSQLANGSEHAFLWQRGAMRDLGTLGGRASYALDINERGLIVGVSQTVSGEWHGFLWEKGKMRDLGTLPGRPVLYISRTAESPGTYAINEKSQIVGNYSYGPEQSSIERGFFWQRGKMRGLGTLGGRNTYPEAISGRGWIVGGSWTNAPQWGAPVEHAFIWRGGKMKDLGTLGGKESYARDLDTLGRVVGRSDTKDGKWHAVLWRAATVTDLGVLPNTRYSDAVAMNQRGQIVGISYRETSGVGPDLDSRAFVWHNGVMTDLGGKYPYSESVSINEHGWIVGGVSRHPLYGIERAVLWTLKR